MHPWKTVVAMGDSFTEGVGEPVAGLTLQSSPDHLAAAMRRTRPDLLYTNLARRGLTVREVREQQLGKALRLGPDFVSLIAGANDALKGVWDAAHYKRELWAMLSAFSGVPTFFMASWPDWTKRLPLPEPRRAQLRAQLREGNAVTAALATEFGAVFLDVWESPVDDDPACWSADHVHPNARGYLAYARLAAQAVEEKTGYTLGEAGE